MRQPRSIIFYAWALVAAQLALVVGVITFVLVGGARQRADLVDLHAGAQAAQLTDPAAARKLWARVDRIVTDQAPWIPLENTAPTVFVSSRAGNYQESAGDGPLLDQTWVR